MINLKSQITWNTFVMLSLSILFTILLIGCGGETKEGDPKDVPKKMNLVYLILKLKME